MCECVQSASRLIRERPVLVPFGIQHFYHWFFTTIAWLRIHRAFIVVSPECQLLRDAPAASAIPGYIKYYMAALSCLVDRWSTNWRLNLNRFYGDWNHAGWNWNCHFIIPHAGNIFHYWRLKNTADFDTPFPFLISTSTDSKFELAPNYDLFHFSGLKLEWFDLSGAFDTWRHQSEARGGTVVSHAYICPR